MIKFSGTLSKQCLTESAKFKNKIYASFISIFTIISIIITILVIILDPSNSIEFVLLTIGIILLNIIIVFIPHKSIIFQAKRIIVFDISNEIITYQLENLEAHTTKQRNISKIKLIIDHKTWYSIHFKMDPTDLIIIEKNWADKDTILEFEQNFKDKFKK